MGLSEDRLVVFFVVHLAVRALFRVVAGSSAVAALEVENAVLRHLTTEPYRPRTNGKVERFHQTMGREWAYGLTYRSHHERAQALPHWLDHYNRHRPHSSLGDRPPISRVHNVRG